MLFRSKGFLAAVGVHAIRFRHSTIVTAVRAKGDDEDGLKNWPLRWEFRSGLVFGLSLLSQIDPMGVSIFLFYYNAASTGMVASLQPVLHCATNACH